MKYNKARGFTIVELLVVVVVIGILAAITIVAYAGVQDKARSAQSLSAVDVYEKAVRLYMADHNGQVPETYAADGSGPGQVCLGEDYLAANGFAQNECVNPDLFGTTVSPSISINSALKEFVPQLPNVAKNAFNLAGQSYMRGLIYYGDNRAIAVGPVFSITYYIDGAQTCGRGTSAVVTVSGRVITQCALAVR